MRTPAAAGGLAALVAGAIMAALAGWTGSLGASLIGIVGLTVPLAIAGVLYGWLVQTRRLRLGFGPGVVFWVVAFPLARLTQEMMLGFTQKGLAGGVVSFAVFQAMVGGAFGLGFFLLHNNIWNLMHRAEEHPDTEGQPG